MANLNQDHSTAAPPKKDRASSNVGGITLTQPMVSIMRIILLVSGVTHILYAWLEQGAEAACGTLTKPQVCYLPGAEWISGVLVAAGVLIIIGFIVLSRVNK